jgi:VWFA-related protein
MAALAPIRRDVLFRWCWCGAGLALLLAITPAATAQGAEKSIFVSVIDSAGRAVRDLAAADFALREDGEEREIMHARLSSQPLQLALLADTTGGAGHHVPPLRRALQTFTEAILAAHADSQISLWTFGERPRRMTDFTSDAGILGQRIGALFPTSNGGSLLLDTIHQTSEALAKRPSRRRAIVVLNVEPADEQSELAPKKINESLARSGAQLWMLSLQIKVSDAQRNYLLRTFSRNAGGQLVTVASDSGLDAQMQRFADALNNQYELIYRRPAGSANVVQTGIRRDGMQVVAGLFAPR